MWGNGLRPAGDGDRKIPPPSSNEPQPKGKGTGFRESQSPSDGLAVHSGSRGSAPAYLPHKRHHGRLAASFSDRAASNWWSSLICLSFSRSWSLRISTRESLSPAFPGVFLDSPVSISTIQRKPCAVVSWWPLSTPLDMRRRTVWTLTCRCSAASAIVICIASTLPNEVASRLACGYLNFKQFCCDVRHRDGGGVVVWAVPWPT